MRGYSSKKTHDVYDCIFCLFYTAQNKPTPKKQKQSKKKTGRPN